MDSSAPMAGSPSYRSPEAAICKLEKIRTSTEPQLTHLIHGLAAISLTHDVGVAGEWLILAGSGPGGGARRSLTVAFGVVERARGAGLVVAGGRVVRSSVRLLRPAAGGCVRRRRLHHWRELLWKVAGLRMTEK